MDMNLPSINRHELWKNRNNVSSKKIVRCNENWHTKNIRFTPYTCQQHFHNNINPNTLLVIIGKILKIVRELRYKLKLEDLTFAIHCETSWMKWLNQLICNATESVTIQKRFNFRNNTVPELFATIKLLESSVNQLATWYRSAVHQPLEYTWIFETLELQ